MPEETDYDEFIKIRQRILDEKTRRFTGQDEQFYHAARALLMLARDFGGLEKLRDKILLNIGSGELYRYRIFHGDEELETLLKRFGARVVHLDAFRLPSKGLRVTAEAGKLPFKPNSFDGVMTSFFFKDNVYQGDPSTKTLTRSYLAGGKEKSSVTKASSIEQILSEINRVLKPGGHYFSFDGGHWNDINLSTAVLEKHFSNVGLHEVIINGGPRRFGEPPTVRRLVLFSAKKPAPRK